MALKIDFAMGKLVDKVMLGMDFREVSEIVGNPHQVIIPKLKPEKVVWQYFNSRGQLEIIFNNGRVFSKSIYLKGELTPNHFNYSTYGKAGSDQYLLDN